jgi:hypothetical protein
MKRLYAGVVCGLLVAGCAQVRPLVDQGIEARRRMNDEQARLSIISLCDIAVGSYWRVLSAEQRALVDRVCGGGVSGQ